MADSLSIDQWAAIDSQILDGNILQALLLIRTHTGAGLNATKDIHWDRYKLLRTERPDDFACTDDEYWKGVFG